MKISTFVDNKLEFEEGEFQSADYDSCLTTLYRLKQWVEGEIFEIENETYDDEGVE